MELNEALNCAHRAQRKAERDILAGRFADALESFRLAAGQFDDALNACSTNHDSPCFSLAYRTLFEQKKFCFRQVEILALKLQQLQQQERFLLVLNNCGQHQRNETDGNREKMMTHRTSSAVSNTAEKPSSEAHFDSISEDPFYGLSNLDCGRRITDASSFSPKDLTKVKNRVFSKFDQHDTLLDQLGLPVVEKTEKVSTDPNQKKSGKLGKNETDKIEELRQCNLELRAWIVELFRLLEEKDKEIEALKSRLVRQHDPCANNSSTAADNKNAVIPSAERENTGDVLELAPLELPAYESDVSKGP